MSVPPLPAAYERVFTPGEFARSHLFVPLIGGYHEAEPDFVFERRHYPACELLLVEKGCGAVQHGGGWIPLSAGDVLLHDMRFPHAYRADPEAPFAMHYLVMDGPDLETLWQRFTPAAYVRFNLRYGEPGGIRETLLQVLELMREVEAKPELDIVRSALLYKLLIQTLSHSGGYGRGNRPPRTPEGLEDARAYLDAEYLTVRQIREAAGRASMSLYHFIRRFREQYGMTPKEYVLHKRIHHAKRLLVGTDDPIAHVAEASGFPSYNAFLHAFLRTERQSPGEFRKQWRRTSRL